MNILEELEDFINEFNQDNNEDFSVDSIRIEFSKQHKLEALKKLGKWTKVEKNSSLLSKLKKRLLSNEITSAWRLEKENIYFYNMQDAPKYRTATLVIFGMKQYHKPAPKRELISKLLQVMKDVSSVDICLDVPFRLNLEMISRFFTLTPFITKDGVVTDTRYINDTGTLMLDKVIFYDKAFKNGLQGILWRMEATIGIPSFKHLMLPLYQFKQITDMAKAGRGGIIDIEGLKYD